MRKLLTVGLGLVLLAVLIVPLIPQPVSAMTGSGTAGDPYMIYDLDDLHAMRNDPSACYKLANDIDATATTGWNWNGSYYEGWVPIENFGGKFDGQYYKITNLYSYQEKAGEAYMGLFGVLGSATVENLYLLDIDLTLIPLGAADTQFYAGGLAGYIYGANPTIYRVYTSGSLHITGRGSSQDIAGGMVGYIRTTGATCQISQCASVVAVSGSHYSSTMTLSLGGFVGFIWDAYTTINDCYSRGSVTGGHGTGGFICTTFQPFAGAKSFVRRGYSTGLVTSGLPRGFMSGKSPYTTCSANFWDTQTSGTVDDASCATGKTTAQMKTTSTFTSAGWDFDTIWGRSAYINDGYPYLLWWYDPADMITDINQVVHFQPNAIILGTTLPNRADGGGVYPNGTFSWGDNPAGIEIRLDGFLQPEDVYRFEPIMPGGWDIIEPEPSTMTGDVDLGKLAKNPLRPLVQVLSSTSGLTERLAWLMSAIFILIAIMIAVQLRTDHMVFTALSGFAVSFLFYSIGVWGLWVVILLAFGLVASIVYERMPTL